MAMIPHHRLPPAVLKADIDFCLKCHDPSVIVNTFMNKKVQVDELASKYDHVIMATG